MPHKNHHHAEFDSWQVGGRLLQLIYGPRRAIEGVLIESDGIFTQFVTAAKDHALSSAFFI